MPFFWHHPLPCPTTPRTCTPASRRQNCWRLRLYTGCLSHIYFITGCTKGSGGETLTATLRQVFGLEKMHDVVFTAWFDNKVQFLKDRALKI